MAASPDTAVAASEKVFATFELIEHILLYLPLRGLLLSQRINKATFDVVSNSHDIRRALFKANAAPLQPFYNDKWPDVDTIEWRERMDPETVVVILNPFVRVRSIGVRTPQVVKDNLDGKDCMLYTQHRDSISGFACLRQRTSLPPNIDGREKMLLTSPPVGKIRLMRTVDSHVATVVTDAGTTYGELLNCGSSSPESVFYYASENACCRKHEWKNHRTMPAMYSISQAGSWKYLGRGIDSVTGYELLEILDEKPETELLGGISGGDSESDSDDDWFYD